MKAVPPMIASTMGIASAKKIITPGGSRSVPSSGSRFLVARASAPIPVPNVRLADAPTFPSVACMPAGEVRRGVCVRLTRRSSRVVELAAGGGVGAAATGALAGALAAGPASSGCSSPARRTAAPGLGSTGRITGGAAGTLVGAVSGTAAGGVAGTAAGTAGGTAAGAGSGCATSPVLSSNSTSSTGPSAVSPGSGSSAGCAISGTPGLRRRKRSRPLPPWAWITTAFISATACSINWRRNPSIPWRCGCRSVLTVHPGAG